MKIALIATPYPLEEAPSPPLGLSYVAAACESAGAEVRIFDFIVSKYTPEKLASILDTFNPDVVGANSVTMNVLTAAGIIQAVKRHRPSIITMMGGPHVSFDIKGMLTTYPELDLIVVGEGEQTLLELIPLIQERSSWETVPGIAFRKDGEILITQARPLIHDLDAIPLPARHLLPLSRYQALGFPVSIITSRGCPNQCVFCLGRKMVGNRGRFRSAALVVDEIEQLVSMGFSRINVADDLFTANKNRVRELCYEIRNRNVDFTWSAFARVNTVDLETLRIMRETGCDCVSFGIESGNIDMLKRARKGITLDQARAAVRACKEAGILPHASFMVGLPGESPETLKDTERFAHELNIAHGYHLLAPFPGTTVYEEINRYDLDILSHDWDLYDANHAIVKTSKLSPEEMETFVKEYDRFHEELWQETQQRYREKTCTPYEQLLVEGRARMNLVYRILSEDIIEDTSCEYSSGMDPVVLMSRAISQKTGSDEMFVFNVLHGFHESGFIKSEQLNGRVSFHWTHSPALDALPIPA
ncbi:MAG TPA: radical SAM protein [Deltaproteobacteria bacterium]|nr:radical SAM protein [Deltaproteobacteria bacterium]